MQESIKTLGISLALLLRAVAVTQHFRLFAGKRNRQNEDVINFPLIINESSKFFFPLKAKIILELGENGKHRSIRHSKNEAAKMSPYNEGIRKRKNSRSNHSLIALDKRT